MQSAKVTPPPPPPVTNYYGVVFLDPPGSTQIDTNSNPSVAGDLVDSTNWTNLSTAPGEAYSSLWGYWLGNTPGERQSNLLTDLNSVTSQITSLQNDIANLVDGPAKDAKIQQLAESQANLAATQLQKISAQGSLSSLQSKAVDAVKTQAVGFIMSQQRLKQGKSNSLDLTTP